MELHKINVQNINFHTLATLIVKILSTLNSGQEKWESLSQKAKNAGFRFFSFPTLYQKQREKKKGIKITPKSTKQYYLA